MSLATQGIKFGAHTPILPGGDMLEAINLWEQNLERRMDVVVHFRKWGAPSGDFNLARISLQQASGQGRLPMITWMPVNADGTSGPYALDNIAAGLHDTYLQNWAAGLKGLQTPIYVRLMHEMNGNWYPWSGSPESYVRAWRHVVNVVSSAGASNVKFVWCVNTSDQPKGNLMENYWPGEDWVDVLGIDGYNNYGGWRSFERIMLSSYERVCRLSQTLPVWICETASAEGDGTKWPGTDTTSKAEWIRGMFATEDMERIGAVCWFDERNPKAYDWRIDTSLRAKQALRDELRKAEGYVPAPGPYVPPVPDRVQAQYIGPGAIGVSWREIPSFHRGCHIRVVSQDGHTLSTTVLKPAKQGRMVGVPVGKVTVTVTSFTQCRASRPSTPVEVYVAEPF